ncbi:hypothetical protein [Anaerophaga thermohalophila]|jgi:hypothetical protein|uniref:hypothetical protein n=1 Tax=Anaerophaga thermohalophila TaxID=177400 RepID=UPI000318B166|nr:hypothetical protein [Anaerophaga thermohalophila]
MVAQKFTFEVTLDSDEFVKVEDHLFTTHESLLREEPKIYLIGKGCLRILKEFEDQLTMKSLNEWMLLSRALDQTCGFETAWDDRKILQELVTGRDHPVSWYAHNCKAVS